MIADNGIVIAFWLLAATTVGCALMVAAVRELIQAVLFLALTFVGAAGMYIVLSADFVAVVVFVTLDTDWAISDRGAFSATAASLGEAFLKPYVVPFEVASVLLMVAMIGAIVLTKEEEPE